MSKDNSPVSASMQPGTHLSVDSRPGTVETPFKDERSDISQEIADFIEINSAHLKEASIYITSPFKQGPQRHYQDARTCYDVASPLKQEIFHSMLLHKRSQSEYDSSEKLPSIHKNKTFISRRNQGRLAPLLGKPDVKGPQIKQCVGITSGNHRASNGRGHGQKQFKNISQSHPARLKKIDLFSQQASIHRTSFTSSYSKDRLCSDASSICSDISGAKTQN